MSALQGVRAQIRALRMDRPSKAPEHVADAQPDAALEAAAIESPIGEQPANRDAVTAVGGGGTDEGDEDRLASLESKLNEQHRNAREATKKYLKVVGRRSLWGALLIIGVLYIWLTITRGAAPETDCRPNRCDQFHQGLWAAGAVWSAVAAVSWLKQSDGGLIVMLIGGNGRFSTSYFQAWIWTLVLCWGFAFFLADAVARASADIGAAGNELDADYFLLLGGPFAALVLARQIKAGKLVAGDVQQVASPSTTVRDLLSDDDGRADLIDTQYLFFNFVALAAFAVIFVREPSTFPDLPDGLVYLTSGAALAYVGNKAVERNKPGVTSVTLEAGAGVPQVGDTVRIDGFNFLPPGARTEEYLARVRVRFGAAEAPVTPPAAHAQEAAVDSSAAPVSDEDVKGARMEPSLYADNVTSTALRVKIPPIPGLIDGGRLTQVVVVTSGGAETEPYPLWVQPRRLSMRLPDTAAAGEMIIVHVPEEHPGRVARVTIDGKLNDVVVGLDQTVRAPVPTGSEGTVSVSVELDGANARGQLTVKR